VNGSTALSQRDDRATISAASVETDDVHQAAVRSDHRGRSKPEQRTEPRPHPALGHAPDRRHLNWAMKKNVSATMWPNDTIELRWVKLR
jgi:hypothetical protein